MSKKQSIITLTTDFDLYDEYAGVMKGVIANINPVARVIDISHKIEPHDVFQAACVITNSYTFFPRGTIHVVVVDPGVGSTRKIICLKTEDYVFLAPDNGVLSFIIEKEKTVFIREVTNSELFLKEISNTFHGRDIFAPVAAYLSKGQEFKSLGKSIQKTKKIDLPKPIRSPDGELTAEIIYVDSFGNLISNINREVVDSMKADPGRLSITMGRKRINGICNAYTDVGDKEALAIFGSSGYLEISINRGRAVDVLKLRKGDKLVLSNY